jgi:3-hydroxy acid dehydrogenase/malonic semialdehyde reductase
MQAEIPRVFVVTGASGHLGRAVVEELCRIDGSTVIAASRRTVLAISAGDEREIGNGVDLTACEGAAALASHLPGFRGPVSVVNCIGYFPGYRGFLDISYEESERVFRTNFMAVYFVALSLVPLILNRGGGHFISFSTLASLEAYPMMAAFTTSKAGLEQLSRHLAHEFGGSGLQANSFALATLRTAEEIRLKPRGDHEHWIAPEEVATLVRQFVAGGLNLLNGNVLQCYHYSPAFYATSYLDRINLRKGDD